MLRLTVDFGSPSARAAAAKLLAAATFSKMRTSLRSSTARLFHCRHAVSTTRPLPDERAKLYSGSATEK